MSIKAIPIEQAWYNSQKRIFDNAIQEVLQYGDKEEMERYMLAEECIDMYERRKNGMALYNIWCRIIDRPELARRIK